jgi:hypothetical protein
MFLLVFKKNPFCVMIWVAPPHGSTTAYRRRGYIYKEVKNSRSMSQTPNRLAELLQQAVLAFGAERVQVLQKIRQYIAQTDCTVLNVQLQQIQNVNMLRMLQAAGVPQCIQATFYLQINKALKGVTP